MAKDQLAKKCKTGSLELYSTCVGAAAEEVGL